MDISKLFKWHTVHIITDARGNEILDEDGNSVKVYIRIIGDNDMDTSRRLALRYAKMLRNDYEANREELVPILDGMDKESLIDLIVVNNITEFYRQAERDVELAYPAEKKTPSAKEEEIYSEEVDTYFERLNDAIISKTKEIAENFREYYRGKDEAAIREAVAVSYINKAIEERMNTFFSDCILLFSCFEDPNFTIPVFKDIDEVISASSILKSQLHVAYKTLSLSDTELKK